MKMKTLLIASAMFFSFQVSASTAACRDAQHYQNAAEQEVQWALELDGFGSPRHRMAVQELYYAELNVWLKCTTAAFPGGT